VTDTAERRRFLIDPNVYDLLVATPETQQRVIEACLDGVIELLMTHVQVDELVAMPDRAKSGRALAIPFTQVPTYGIVIALATVTRVSHNLP
jgi:hypothetical protein